MYVLSFGYTVGELQKLGAEIPVCGNTALVFGGEKGRCIVFHRENLDLRFYLKFKFAYANSFEFFCQCLVWFST